MGFNLDFSSWDAANRALAEGTVKTQTTKSQAKASRASGLMSGIGTVVGAIFGAPATGKAIGEALGGGNTSDIETDTDLFDKITDWYKKKKLPKWQQDMSDAERSTIATDPMQVASAMNAITGGDVIDTSVAASKMYGGLV